MTTGEGIVWATSLILIALGIRYIFKTKRWLLVGIILGSLIILGTIVGFGIHFYNQYKNRPVSQTSLFGISLGMKPVDVRLSLGEPLNETNTVNSSGEDVLVYTFQSYSWEGIDRFVRFKNYNGGQNVYQICDFNPDGELYDLYTFTNEDEVIKKFNQPTNESISQDGLRKFLTFKPLNIAVEIEKRQVTTVCVTSDEINYKNEYDSSL